MKNKFYDIKDIFAPARQEAEIQSITNNDVYKFYMLDFILNHPEYKDTIVEWKMTIRNPDIKTADIIPKEQLIEQLKAAQNITGISEQETKYLENLSFEN
jgi:nicotinic acid phosphoribosyltransferase